MLYNPINLQKIIYTYNEWNFMVCKLYFNKSVLKNTASKHNFICIRVCVCVCVCVYFSTQNTNQVNLVQFIFFLW